MWGGSSCRGWGFKREFIGRRARPLSQSVRRCGILHRFGLLEVLNLLMFHSSLLATCGVAVAWGGFRKALASAESRFSGPGTPLSHCILLSNSASLVAVSTGMYAVDGSNYRLHCAYAKWRLQQKPSPSLEGASFSLLRSFLPLSDGLWAFLLSPPTSARGLGRRAHRDTTCLRREIRRDTLATSLKTHSPSVKSSLPSEAKNVETASNRYRPLA